MQKKFFSKYRPPLVNLPNLVQTQVDSYKWLLLTGLKELFMEFSPLNDYTGDKFTLEFLSVEVGEPKYDEFYAKENKMSYEAPLRVKVRLTNKHLNTAKEQEMFLADFPLMTKHGTFVINGVERVVVPQLARSFGAFFTLQELKGKPYFGAKIIPARGAWIEVESEVDGALYVRIDRKRKFTATSLIRAFGRVDSDEDILKLFHGNELAHAAVKTTLLKDSAKTADEAYIEIYKKLRDGELASAANARDFFKNIFSAERYDMSRVGRFRFNKRFGKGMSQGDMDRTTISVDDIATIIAHIVTLNNTPGAQEDDIDHLGSRRVRAVGEMMQQKLRVGLSQIKRQIQDRMSTIDQDSTLPIHFINSRPLQARMKEFFTTNQLSQFMMQENIL
ncbi:MAG: DNA-directed RNA polymerase subunit beta, partial [Candidatus Lloydbacteria bacterium]|nr:DNA-directed RNA polymerase subunit beta [Candidatus Lloydbacteria bacterium]